jgi:hypothetical protein
MGKFLQLSADNEIDATLGYCENVEMLEWSGPQSIGHLQIAPRRPPREGGLETVIIEHGTSYFVVRVDRDFKKLANLMQ